MNKHSYIFIQIPKCLRHHIYVIFRLALLHVCNSQLLGQLKHFVTCVLFFLFMSFSAP